MDVFVKMSEQELQQLLKWKEEKKVKRAEENRLELMAQKVLWALGADAETGQVIVTDAEHAEELLEMANMYLE